MKYLKSTSDQYCKFTAGREIVSVIPLTTSSGNTKPHLFCRAEFKYDDRPNYSILILKSDIITK